MGVNGEALQLHAVYKQHFFTETMYNPTTCTMLRAHKIKQGNTSKH